MTTKHLLAAVVISATTAVGSLWAFEAYKEYQPLASTEQVFSSIFKQAKYAEDEATSPGDFEKAASKAAPAVVHIKVSSRPQHVSQQNPRFQGSPFGDFFGETPGEEEQSMEAPGRKGSGSGVLISADGYIVTNNHVVEGSDEITVTLWAGCACEEW